MSTEKYGTPTEPDALTGASSTAYMENGEYTEGLHSNLLPQRTGEP